MKKKRKAVYEKVRYVEEDKLNAVVKYDPKYKLPKCDYFKRGK